MSFVDRLFAPERIYMDYAAATPVLPEAARTVQAVSERLFANPGSLHKEGVAAATALSDARKRVARMLECKAGQVVFTSGGTEGNNLAVFGAVRAIAAQSTQRNRTHVITSAIEHPSILEPFRALEQHGVEVTYLTPNSQGIISADILAEALTPHTVLVSIGWMNSEIGVVQSLSALAQVIRDYEKKQRTTILFHTDAGQAPLYLSSHIVGVGVDSMTLDSGKLYGPRGVGALFIRDKTHIRSIMYGGGQESGLRPGSENVALASGFAVACEQAARTRAQESRRLLQLRSAWVMQLKETVPQAVVHGPPQKKVAPHIVNISVPDIDSEYVLFALDHAGVAVSTKSSCREGEEDSHVVAALGGEPWYASTTLRFSFGRDTTHAHLTRAITLLGQAIATYKRAVAERGEAQ